MNVDQCRATVFLHEPLRQSLASWLGDREVASMHRCALDSGHSGEHVGLPEADGRGSFRWDEGGVHIGMAQDGQHGRWSAPPGTTQPAGGRHAAGARAPAESTSRTQTQALWALTAAVERLTDVVSATRGRPLPISYETAR